MNTTGNDAEVRAMDWDVRPFGWILVVASVLATMFALMHPQITGNDLAGVMRQMVAGATFAAWVHGILIALYLATVAGFFGLTRYLGFDRPAAVIGLVCYAAGIFAMTGAAVINGFALEIFSGRYPTVRPGDVMALASSFNIASSIAVVWAGLGAVATSGAILAWSVCLLAQGGPARVIGVFGILLALATVAMLVTGTLILNVHGFLLLVVSQAAWTIAVAVRMIGGRV